MRVNSSNKRQQDKRSALLQKAEAGFTLLEMVIAMLIMLIGLLALASVIGYALMVSNKGRNITNSKLLVVSMLEQMETLRNTKQLTFGQISNVGAVDSTGATTSFNGFPNTFEPVSTAPGPDGIFGTSDDLVTTGPDGNYGTADDRVDQTLAIPGYYRQVIVTSLSPNLKKVQVTLRYPGDRGETQTRTAISYLNNDSHNNYRP